MYTNNPILDTGIDVVLYALAVAYYFYHVFTSNPMLYICVYIIPIMLVLHTYKRLRRISK